MTNNIPAGRTKEDIKAREKLIKDFYAQWIAEHPEKKNLEPKPWCIHQREVPVN